MLPKPPFPVLDRGHPLAQGLVFAAPLYEGSGLTANDVSGFGNNGALNGVSWVAGQFGRCLSITSTSGNQNVDFGKPFSGSLTNFSFGGWFYLPALPGTNQQYNLFGWANSNIGGSGVLIEVGSANATVPHAWQAQQNNTGYGTAAAVSAVAGVWTFVVLTWNSSSGGILYVNGVATATATTSVGNPGSGSDLIAGNPSTWQSVAWLGNVDGLFFYNRALSQAEIAALYFDSFAMYRPQDPILHTGATVFTVSGTGGCVVGSTATSSPAWTPAPSGGAVDGSSATAAPTWNMAPSGGAVDGSSGTAAPSWTQSPSGGCVGGSDAGFAATWNMAPSGGAVAGSGGTAVPNWTPTPSGGAVEGSGASASQSGGVFTESGTGGSVAGSGAAATPAWTLQAVGGALAGGLATVLQTAPPLAVILPDWIEADRPTNWLEIGRGNQWIELADGAGQNRSITVQLGITTMAKQRPGESRTYTVDFSRLDEFAGGDTIGSIGQAVAAPWGNNAPGATAPSVSTPIVVSGNTQLKVTVSGGVQNTTFQIRLPVTTVGDATLIGVFNIEFTWQPSGTLV